MISKLFTPSDFCPTDIDPDKSLSEFERRTLTGGADLTRALNWAARKFAGFSFPESIGPIDPLRIAHAAEFYGKLMPTPGSAPFFSAPQRLPTAETQVIHGLPDGAVIDLSFNSSFRAHSPELEQLLAESPENNTVHARLWRHNGGSRATVIALPGWTMADHRINSLVFLPGMLYRRGLDVVLFELPFHGKRSAPNSSDQALFPSAEVFRTNEAMAQVISDLRELRLYLQSTGAEKVGVMGMSLGGYIAALWTALDPLDFSVPIVPFASMGEVAWEYLSRRPDFAELRDRGLDPDLLNAAYDVHSPLTYKSQLTADQIMIIAGINDTIIPPRQPSALCKHFRYPEMHWFTGGHVAQLKREHAFEKIVSFLAELGLAEGEED